MENPKNTITITSRNPNGLDDKIEVILNIAMIIGNAGDLDTSYRWFLNESKNHYVIQDTIIKFTATIVSRTENSISLRFWNGASPEAHLICQKICELLALRFPSFVKITD